MEKLRIVEEGQERYFDLIGKRVVSIGRSSQNDIAIRDRNTSRKHCNILEVGGSWFAVDCESHNGIWVNGVRVSKKELANGDKVTIGAVDITFLTGKEPSANEQEKPANPVAPNAQEPVGEKKVESQEKKAETDSFPESPRDKKKPEAAPIKPEEEEEYIDVGDNNVKDKPPSPSPSPSPSLPDKIEFLEPVIKEGAKIAEPMVGKIKFPDDKIEELKAEVKEPLSPKEKKSDKHGKSLENIAKELGHLREFYHKFQVQMGLQLVGQEKIGKLLITSLLAGGHCIIHGESLSVKMLLMQRMAKILDLSFRHLYWSEAYTPDLLRRPNLLLVQNLPSDLLLSMLCETLVAKPLLLGERIHKLPDPYLVVLSEDTPSTEAMPRMFHNFFLFDIGISTTTPAEDAALLDLSMQKLDTEKPLLSPQDFQLFQMVIDSVKVLRTYSEYIVRLVRATRPEEEDVLPFVREKISKGVDNTLGVWILKGARATAALHGRDNVSVKDIQGIARYLIVPRLQLSPSAVKMGDKPEAVYNMILSKIKEPVE